MQFELGVSVSVDEVSSMEERAAKAGLPIVDFDPQGDALRRR